MFEKFPVRMSPKVRTSFCDVIIDRSTPSVVVGCGDSVRIRKSSSLSEIEDDEIVVEMVSSISFFVVLESLFSSC